MSLAERLLIARLRAREEEAFAEVVQLHGDKVFSLVYRLVGNRSEAEDVAQEVFVTVWKSIETFRGEAKFSTWLLRIAANHAKNRVKYLSRRAGPGSEALEEAGAADSSVAGPALKTNTVAPDQALETAERDHLLQQGIAALDDDQRLVIVLRDIEEMSYEEICEITGLPEGTVKSRLHRARAALKVLILGGHE
jgi:RNA polymerase sigma-70 factor (ECF subfamily)